MLVPRFERILVDRNTDRGCKEHLDCVDHRGDTCGDSGAKGAYLCQEKVLEVFVELVHQLVAHVSHAERGQPAFPCAVGLLAHLLASLVK